MNNMPQFLFGNDVNYSTYSPRSINKTFSIVLKNVDGTIDEKELLNDIQAIENEVTAIHRIKNAALDKPTPLVRIDCGTETCRDRLLAIRKLVVSPFAFPIVEYIPPTKIIRCYKCQGLGHYAHNCLNQLKCSKCSGPHSIEKCVSTTVTCSNCGGDHRASYPGCKARLSYINVLKSKQFSSVVSNTSQQQRQQPTYSTAASH
ncbi:unnamed protein product [Didymodactylos carnosus]|uniref:CCHC-type domain-containing protein n=1 Tax=Didymodactylos carnosus TaxID=1234261 RepID=A0A814QUI9_9BILA|nr:unnamed protein product [Didymodactylos carnosus]CAF1265469.1 unnamed protein product [Didymodactylos carnosus]CAF3887965.1 unnamed protein product [Didymodactylos carnosus]CAF4071690.1 unnamed protein product [Didymodactylos carnosus]